MILRKSFESKDEMGFALIDESNFVTKEILVVTNINSDIRKKFICANLLITASGNFETSREEIDKEIISIMKVPITFI